MVGVKGDKRVTSIRFIPERSKAGTKGNAGERLLTGVDKNEKDSRRGVQEIQTRKNPAHPTQVAGT